MKIKDKVFICSECRKSINYENKGEKFRKPKICAECFLYGQKKFQKICLAFLFISLFFVAFLFIPISRKVQLIIALGLFFISSLVLIGISILKVIRKRIYFDD